MSIEGTYVLLKTLTLLMVPSVLDVGDRTDAPDHPRRGYRAAQRSGRTSVWPLVTVSRLVPSLFISFIKPAVDEADSPRTATMAATPIAMPRADRPARSLRVRMPTARQAGHVAQAQVRGYGWRTGYSCRRPWRPEEAAGGGPSETTKPSSNRTTRFSARRHPHVVGDDGDGGALGVELGEQVEHRGPRGRVQVASGLVSQHDGRAADDGPGNGHALALATRELGGE